MIRTILLLAVASLFIFAGCGGKATVEVDDNPVEAEVVEQVPVVPEIVVEEEIVPDYAAMAPIELGIDDVFFEFDSYTLSEEAMAVLEASSGIFKNYGNFMFVIEGHCDERGTVEYNLALGEKRSIAVRDYLISLGVDRTKLRITSYGEERPFASGSDESAWSLNRRVHFARP
ncbi:OmpA family protein [bacterium]|jgi:peptidoglycan-associated lipoprotein|nr:OmpA family protein [bacterium]MBT7310773.1 OmpA family protein [bacterium]